MINKPSFLSQFSKKTGFFHGNFSLLNHFFNYVTSLLSIFRSIYFLCMTLCLDGIVLAASLCFLFVCYVNTTTFLPLICHPMRGKVRYVWAHVGIHRCRARLHKAFCRPDSHGDEITNTTEFFTIQWCFQLFFECYF